MKINFEKLKSAMDDDGDFIIDETKQEIRYFEFKDPHSSKFWEVSVAASTVTVRYGKIGTNGQTSVKELDSPEEAQEHARKQAAGKLKKGYSEDDDSDSIEEILIIRTGGGWEEEYRISVETHFVGEDDYDVVAEFGSDIEEIENAVNCYIENGGSIEAFKSFSS